MGISEDILRVARMGQQDEVIKALREELAHVNKLLKAQLAFNDMLSRNIRDLEGKI